MATTDTATFYVRKTEDRHTKWFITYDLADILGSLPAIEIDMSLYDKSDIKNYHVGETVEQFLATLDKESGDEGLIEKVSIVGGSDVLIFEITTSYGWKKATPAVEAAFEQLTDGEQVNFMPFETIFTRQMAVAGAR